MTVMEIDKELSEQLKKISERIDALNALYDQPKTRLEKHFMLWTTVVAFLTAAASLKIIYWMNSSDGLDHGLGLAAIGIVTFFGVSLSSSIFEEHRHDHKAKHNPHFISNVIVGTGIMRKGLAASLVITYIVLIGFSFSAGTLDNPLDGVTKPDTIPAKEGDKPTTGDTNIRTQSPNININLENIGITDIREYDKIQVKKTNSTSNSIEELILEKEPSTLVEHFTIVISVVVGFYFGSNTLAALLKARKEDKTPEDLSKILKGIADKGKVTEKDIEKLKSL